MVMLGTGDGVAVWNGFVGNGVWVGGRGVCVMVAVAVSAGVGMLLIPSAVASAIIPTQ